MWRGEFISTLTRGAPQFHPQKVANCDGRQLPKTPSHAIRRTRSQGSIDEMKSFTKSSPRRMKQASRERDRHAQLDRGGSLSMYAWREIKGLASRLLANKRSKEKASHSHKKRQRTKGCCILRQDLKTMNLYYFLQ